MCENLHIPRKAVLFSANSERQSLCDIWSYCESLVEWKVLLITLNKTEISRLHPWHPLARLQKHPYRLVLYDSMHPTR